MLNRRRKHKRKSGLHFTRRRKPQFYRRSSLLLALTAVYMLLFVTPVFVGHYKGVEVATDELISQGVFDLVIAYIQTFCLFFALTVFRIVWILLWPLLALFTIANDYAYSMFHTQVSKYAIAAFLEPETHEVKSILAPDMALTLASAVCFALLGIYMLTREKKDPRNRQVALVALLFAVGLITVNQGGASTPYPPYNFLTAGYQYGYERLGMMSTDRRDITEIANATYTSSSEEPLVVVVAIGESARSDHFSINGYGRETTPLLLQRKNLANFKDTLSCDVWTRSAVPCMMTRATVSDPSLRYSETSFISIFRKLGFFTAWHSTQGVAAVFYPVTSIAHEAEEIVMLEQQQVLDNVVKDEMLLPLLEQKLAKQDGPMLIVLHMYGSHWQYSARYTKEFERYKPVCETTLSRKYSEKDQLDEIKDCYSDPQALVNSYDNSILYTDYVLDQIMKRLENRNALLVFTPDHGESLGENGRFLHGHADQASNRLVPMFWWASDSYIASHAAAWNALVQKAATPVSHDVIFHSILGCAGISSSLIDPALNLCHVDPAAALESPPAETQPPAVSGEPVETEEYEETNGNGNGEETNGE